ncbi:MAG: nicotinate-nucleotide--dimethylbenzimidazole phosphoribosyltransferase [Clostridiales bacterium]|nr:nicotinate-nucleotide--dimethylbenzimidazole phosphoribosyltransferase [Clostridiales bacterium]MCF8023585.1 nicotinate-nucleotide--dimethylbenzimidazole phosphoribosyltransferase [Clostridiales bacterium]
MKLEEAVKNIEPASKEWFNIAGDYLNNLAIPPGSLGELLDLARRLASMKETLKPSVQNKAVVTMAGDHGVVEEGVSAFPQEVTLQMVGNFAAGGASINALAEAAGANVIVVDMGAAGDLDDFAREGKILSRRAGSGTGNMAKGPAMSREQAERALETGIEIAGALVHKGVNLLGTGDMGIGNTTPSSAILAAFSGYPAYRVAGRGTGLNDEALENKARVIEKALDANKPDPADPVDVLAKVGGFEIGGIAGVILGAAYHKVPVVVDGFISSAGALLAKGLAPQSVDYMIASHLSHEYGHRFMLEELGLRPLLDLNLRLGEGTGAALAMNLVESAAQVINKVLTFQDAGVSKNEEPGVQGA